MFEQDGAETDLVRLINITIMDHKKYVRKQDCNQFGEARGQTSSQENYECNLSWDWLTKDIVALLSELLRGAAAYAPIPEDGPFNSATVQQIGDVLGHYLFGLLFDDERTNRLLNDALNSHRARRLSFVRIELEFAGDDANRLSALPWEYIRLPRESYAGAYLVHQSQLVLNRRLHLPENEEWPPLMTEGPVSILVVAASPALPERDGEPCLAHVSAEPLKTKLAELKAELGERLLVEVLQDPPRPGDHMSLDPEYKPHVTRESLSRKIIELKPHVVHFIGHGQRSTEQRGQLALSGDNCRPDWINEEEFADLVCNNRHLRLVILQACESALPSRYVAGASGVASHIAARKIPAVVAMQYSIDAAAANTFAIAFYAKILCDDAVPVDVAVSSARHEMSISGRRDTRSSMSLPVVYLLDYHGLMRALKKEQPNVTKERVDNILTPQAVVPCKRCKNPVQHDANRCGICALVFVCNKCDKRWDPIAKYCSMCPPDVLTYVTQQPWTPDVEPTSKEQGTTFAGFSAFSSGTTGPEP